MGYPRTRTMTDMILDVRRRANMERMDPVNGFIPDAEVVRHLQTGLQKVHSLMVEAYGEDYFYNEYSVTVSGGTPGSEGSDVALPPDFFKLLGIDLQITAQQTVALKPFQRFQRNMYRNAPYISWYGIVYRYRIMGQMIRFIPQAQSSIPITMMYVPLLGKLDVYPTPAAVAALAAPGTAAYATFPAGTTITAAKHGFVRNQPLRFTPIGTGTLDSALRSDTDYYAVVPTQDTLQLSATYLKPQDTATVITLNGDGTGLTQIDAVFDGVNGWEEFAILSAAIKCLQKEESDTTELRNELMEMNQTLVNMAEDRDASFASQVQDVQRDVYSPDYNRYGY